MSKVANVPIEYFWFIALEKVFFLNNGLNSKCQSSIEALVSFIKRKRLYRGQRSWIFT